MLRVAIGGFGVAAVAVGAGAALAGLATAPNRVVNFRDLPRGWPIRAGFFYRTIPKEHLSKVRRAMSLELREGGRLIARQHIPLPKLPPVPR